jgi:heptosyltransferase II
MNILIAKLGATGDVVRTSALLRVLKGRITWVTSEKNTPFVKGIQEGLRCLAWESRAQARDCKYDLAINLEDTADVAEFVQSLSPGEIFGAYLQGNALTYTKNSHAWFDLSLISTYGREVADKLKLENRRTYQDLLFEGVGYRFQGEEYLLPQVEASSLQGDIAVATESGAVWPMKKWAYYDDLKKHLEKEGFTVNVLPQRPTMLEHLADVQGHRVLVGGDTLPMHLALGSRVKCVSIFNCTSPWEIFDYGRQTKIVSPLLPEFFYKRDFDVKATTAVPLEQVLSAVLEKARS